MRVLESGKINLYDETTKNMIPGPNGMSFNGSTTQLYAAKGSDSVKELEYSQFGAIQFNSKKDRMNVLAEMLKDNKDVYDKFIAGNKFSFDQIKYLVHLYNTGLSDPGKPKDLD